jgi:MSHA biogenesis protein MshJ
VPDTTRDGARRLYRHGIELQLEGSWSDLHAYLKAIEKLPKQVLWSRIDLQVDKHPMVTMKRRCTMSMERAWIAL